MATQIYHLLYLHPGVEDAQWSHLHRFVHPGSRSDPGWKSMLCTNLDLSHHVFLSCKAKSYSGGGPKAVSLRYDLVLSIVEVGSHTIKAGFVDPDGFPAVDPEKQ